MAHKKDDEKTKDFVNFLLEESSEDYNPVASDEVGETSFDEESREYEVLDLENGKIGKGKNKNISSSEKSNTNDVRNNKVKPKKVISLEIDLENFDDAEIEENKKEENKKEDLSQKTESHKSHDFPTMITKKEDSSDTVAAVTEVGTASANRPDPSRDFEEELEKELLSSLAEAKEIQKNSDKVEDEKAKSFPNIWKKSFDDHRPSPASSNSDSPILVSENLRMAQEKILSLEKEIDRLREENQELQAASEVFRSKNEDLMGKFDELEYRKKEIEEKWRDDAKLSQIRVSSKQQEVQDLRVKVESLELRLRRDLQMVRVRERELENRLEISKLENSAVLRSKDEHILELKRKMDQMSNEADQLKEKLSGLSQHNDISKDKIRRTVRTLRLALNMLDEDTPASDNDLKKSS